MQKPLNIAMIGTGFMGRAHSHAWLSAPRFFDLPRQVVLKAICGRDLRRTRQFAERWGWQSATTDAADVFRDPEVDLIDLVTPNHLHAEHAIAALKHGKHVACEKPLARTAKEGLSMVKAAAAAHRKLGNKTFVWFNYRRCPALALAHQFAQQGRLGAVQHVRARYLQQWGGAATPMAWRFQRDLAGSGAHGDLNSHLVDAARFITADEIVAVHGALSRTFVAKRTGKRAGSRRTPAALRSTVDDCLLFLASFKSGATASFEASRVATGHLNRNTIEVNAEKASLRFDLERMNELEWFDATLPATRQGWTTIHCTDPSHPYVSAYWPPGHSIGYEHTFISQAADIVRAIAHEKLPIPMPDFSDALQTQRVLEAAEQSARRPHVKVTV